MHNKKICNNEYYSDDIFKLISGDITLNYVEDYSKLLDQLNTDYINNEDLNNMDNLVKDIAELKAYRDYLENFENDTESIINFITIVLTTILALLGLNSIIVIDCYVWLVIIILLIIIATYYFRRWSKKSPIYKIRQLNRFIYKLEVREYYYNKDKANFDNQYRSKPADRKKLNLSKKTKERKKEKTISKTKSERTRKK